MAMKTTADGLIRRNKTKRLLPDSVLFHSRGRSFFSELFLFRLSSTVIHSRRMKCPRDVRKR